MTTATFAMPATEDNRKAWWGLMYLRAICAQAGFRVDESPPQGDIYSLDAQVFMRPSLSVGVQVKCTSTPIARKRSFNIKPAWRTNWETLDLPAYFVVVSVPAVTPDWVQHAPGQPWRTQLQSAAFWTRIDPLAPDQDSITVLASQRLTLATFDEWAHDLETARRGFGGD